MQRGVHGAIPGAEDFGDGEADGPTPEPRDERGDADRQAGRAGPAAQGHAAHVDRGEEPGGHPEGT